MKLLAVAVRDAAVGAFLPPMFMRSKGEALRSFIDACGDDKAPFVRHPEDFGLYLIGEFDDNTGVFEPLSMPLALLSADEAMTVRREGNGSVS